MIEVHYFAAARQAAGVACEQVPATATLGELVRYLGNAHDGATAAGMHFPEVLARCSFLADGVAAHTQDSLAGVARVDVLPPFAGG
ncbi:molybdopterin biosynthesis protein MoaD2 [Corynebacterium phocae]|uniref:Molybdopterin biosynthesis protein MoaD2 n=1 Tax=Corynebacterium phocae TaxID=161895 RepID=A0A1L7D0T2_9CORY|nr:MoaD/ThiS family protein [Corynebacterium phocae]APT91697.1 molybdopterin biosynthesis protein MoaD2 [Corynebacterium phocae]KAA8728605.1 MoaD/ThiS family protein [Corynebacterium phocae]